MRIAPAGPRGTQAEASMKMKLINLDKRANIATLECECGGLTLISAAGATEAMPNRGRCPVW